jgi:hypothetical protein
MTTVFLQHNDPYILIPQHISRQAFYSIQVIGFCIGAAYQTKYYITCLIISILYTTSMLHWNKILYTSIIKKLDIFTVIILVLNVTFNDSYYYKEYKIYWFICCPLFILSFIMNETLFYYQVLKNDDKKNDDKRNDDKRNDDKRNDEHNFHYFSLQYTEPNTRERELAYYRSTYTHMLNTHIIPFLVCLYCAICSPYSHELPELPELPDSFSSTHL